MFTLFFFVILFIRVIHLKKVIVFLISICIVAITIFFIDPITDSIANALSNEQKLVIKPSNKYSKDKDYLFVQKTEDFIPYSYQDLLNIYYSVIDNGWNQFTFYCPKEYSKCVQDITSITSDELILTHLNNYVHPFNSFTNIKTKISESGEMTITVYYLYTSEEIEKIDKKTDEVLANIITDEMNDYDKIKTIHDYIINNTKYDVSKNESEKESIYNSYIAYGPLFEGYATCNGYTDLMAIYLTKLGFDNYKIATTKDEISYGTSGHIWNAVNYEGNWLHLDLTWDDPVSSDNQDYLFHTYFLVDTKALKDADMGSTIIEEHNFNPLYYLEFN